MAKSMEFLSYAAKLIPTEEQLEYVKSFNQPTICFASPGTGKTAASMLGLLYAEFHREIPGDKIYAMSFTQNATLEINNRHADACKAMGLPQRVNFKTIHSLCLAVLKKYYERIGFNQIPVVKDERAVDTLETIQAIISDYDCAGEPVSQNQLYPIYSAVQALDSSLSFDRKNIENKMVFKKARISYELLTYIRKQLLKMQRFRGYISMSSILLFTLELLETNPDIVEELKDSNHLMLVDECQDMSILQLKLISHMTRCPILVGDIKQQIYAFNGACPELVEQFDRLFPGATHCHLTQSFRCSEEIASFANTLIMPNRKANDPFKGAREGGLIRYVNHIDYKSIVKEIAEDYFNHRHSYTKSYLFLFRNNISSTSIVEELFKAKVPFMAKYQDYQKVPVISEMIGLLQLAQNPRDTTVVKYLACLVPELTKSNPVKTIMINNQCSLFDIKYKFKDEYYGDSAMSLLLELGDLIKEGALLKDLLNKLWPMFKERYLSKNSWKMEFDPDYYISTFNYVIRGKTLSQFVTDEREKKEWIDTHANTMVKCYTLHSSKGLEADTVYIIDADPNIIPPYNKLSKMYDSSCYVDLAKEIRNERSLAYVGVTRAKTELVIQATDKPSPIFFGGDDYKVWDSAYYNFVATNNDVEEFIRLAKESRK